jgi:MraZ protein
MSGYIGQFLHTVDHKGRVSFAKVRRMARGRKDTRRFITTKGLDGCLFVYPTEEWDQIVAKLRELPRFEKKTRHFVRHIMPNAAETNLDAQGRIMIPQTLLDIARIEKEVLIVGALDHLELWAPEAFRAYHDTSGLTFEDAAQDMLI